MKTLKDCLKRSALNKINRRSLRKRHLDLDTKTQENTRCHIKNRLLNTSDLIKLAQEEAKKYLSNSSLTEEKTWENQLTQDAFYQVSYESKDGLIQDKLALNYQLDTTGLKPGKVNDWKKLQGWTKETLADTYVNTHPTSAKVFFGPLRARNLIL